jgi:hypothetical protein
MPPQKIESKQDGEVSKCSKGLAQLSIGHTRQTRGFDWRVEDRMPAVLFNQIVWKGLTDGLPYPTRRNISITVRTGQQSLRIAAFALPVRK